MAVLIGQKQGISTHALRMEGDLYLKMCHTATLISTHALRMEGDA